MRNYSLFHVYKFIRFYLGLVLVMSSCQKSINKSCPCQGFTFYEEASDSINYYWFPSGWMGSLSSITCTENWIENPHSGLTCIRITYNTDNYTLWAGIYWLNNNSWNGPGINVYETFRIPYTRQLKITFWCRGETGGETVQFKIGGVSGAEDSIILPVESSWIKLTKTWSKYEIDLSGQDLSNLVGGFCWVVNNVHNPSFNNIILYIDDINYETSN